MSRHSPLGAFVGGLAAGFAGALAQNVFFAATKKIAPTSSTDSFQPAEPNQLEEMPTQTIARRAVEDLMQRGPLVHKSAAGQIVHLAFGSGWGALYGLLAGTLPRCATVKGGVAFGLAVWAASDDVILPAFRLSAWPQHYAVKTHLYAIAAHAVYGAAVALAFRELTRAARPTVALLGSAWSTRRVPRLLRPRARRVVERGLYAAYPLGTAMAALR